MNYIQSTLWPLRHTLVGAPTPAAVKDEDAELLFFVDPPSCLKCYDQTHLLHLMYISHLCDMSLPDSVYTEYFMLLEITWEVSSRAELFFFSPPDTTVCNYQSVSLL